MAVTSDSKYIIAGMADSSIKIFDFDPKLEAHHFKEAHERNFSHIRIIISQIFFRRDFFNGCHL